MVEEWVPNITLPPPPDTPLEEEDPAEQRLDEHGLPSFDDEPEEPDVPRSGPARLFVGMGQRGRSVAPLEAATADDEDEGEGDDDEYVYSEPDGFFVAELRLPRPQDSLPFRMGEGSVDDDEERSSEVLLDAVESSDPNIALPDLDLPFSVSLEAPDPLHLGAFGDEDEDEDEELPVDDDQGEADDVDEEDVFAALAALGDLEDDEDDSEDGLDDEELDALLGGGLPPLALRPSSAREPLHARAGDAERPSGPLAGAPPPPITLEPPGLLPEAEPEPRASPEVWARPGAPPPEDSEPEPPQPEPATPVHTGPRQVLRSRPFWTKDRPLKESSPEAAPLFQLREGSGPEPLRGRVFNWPNLGLLLALLVIVAALWVLLQGG